MNRAQITVTLYSVFALGASGIVACNDTQSPRPGVALAAPATLMVGDAVPLDVKVVGADSQYVYVAGTPFGVVAPVESDHFVDAGEPRLYGVSSGTAQITVTAFDMKGDGTSTTLGEASASVSVVPPLTSNRPGFLEIEGGEFHSCGLSADGSVFCWGATRAFREFTPRCTQPTGPHELAVVCNSVPAKLPAIPPAKHIHIGTYSTCVLTIDDDAFCWGIGPYNYSNTSGNPATVPGGIKFAALSVETGLPLNNGGEAEHVCGVTTSTQVYCWRRGGNPTVPSQIAGVGYTTISVGGVSTTSSDGYRACALDSSGTAHCWGTLALGDGNAKPPSEQLTPVAVGGGLRFTTLASGSYSTCGLTSEGQAYCWGGPAIRPAPSPTAVPTTIRFTSIRAGATRFCGVGVDQMVYCWNDTEAIGPALDQAAYHFRSVSVGGRARCGLTVEGPEVCWGSRSWGDLGDGVIANTATTTATPVAGQRMAP